jgi:hypothetical protein
MMLYPQLRELLLYVHGADYFFIEENQNGNVPHKSYGTYKINWVTGPERGNDLELQDDGTRQVVFNRKSQIDVNFYGENAFAEAEKLACSLGLETTVDFASTVGLQINNRQNVVNISETMGNQKYNRAMLEFSCLWVNVVTETVEIIESAEIISSYPTFPALDGVFSTGEAS